MTSPSNARPLTDRERQIAARVLGGAHLPGTGDLLAQLPTAVVTGGTATVLDLQVPPTTPRATLDDGPLPIETTVTAANGEILGEILIWVNKGHLSGLEFAWVTDEAPTEWPLPEQITLD
jgi:hypothetical protein